MRHHTKDKGDLGVLKVKLDLYEKGWLTLNPETEHAPFDIVAYKDGIFQRLQVKYRTTARDGRIELQFKTSWTDKNGSHHRAYDKQIVDYFAIYCPCNDSVYYVKSDSFDKSCTLDTKDRPTGNKASDYLALPDT
jgi:hypothetical protein